METPPPPTVPATHQDELSPTSLEAAESLLLLQEKASDSKVEGAFQNSPDLEGEPHPGGDESTIAAAAALESLLLHGHTSSHVMVTMDVQMEEASDTAVMVDAGLMTISAEETLEGDDAPPEPTTERRCSRNNGRGWWCSELAYPGYATCWKHIRNRRGNIKRMKAEREQASPGSEAIVSGTEGTAAASAVDEADGATSMVNNIIADTEHQQ